MSVFSTVDETKLRSAPPPATRVTFPNYKTNGPSHYAITAKLSPEKLQKLFRFKRITDINSQHLEAINVQITPNVDVNRLVEVEFLPAKEWEKEPDTMNDAASGPSSKTLSNGAAIPSHEAYYLRLKELLYDCRDVYHFLNRARPEPTRKQVKVVHFRKFWSVLQQMGGYWDTSVDDYLEEGSSQQDDPQQSSTVSILSSTPSTSQAPDAMDIDPSPTSQAPTTSPSNPASTPVPSSTQESKPPNYRGRRVSTGSAMPATIRDDLIRAFIDALAWPFGCRLERPRSQPHLYLGATRINVDYSGLLFRTPEDRARNRAGMLEGPLCVVQCRNEMGFGNGNADVLDLLKEVGALLAVAQQRAREGQSEVVPGADKWWAEKKRWGGGNGEAVGTPLFDDDGNEVAPLGENGTQTYAAVAASSNADDEPPTKRRNGGPTKRSKEQRAAFRRNMVRQSWEPPKPTWEKKISYMKIGKEQKDESDTVRRALQMTLFFSHGFLRVYSIN